MSIIVKYSYHFQGALLVELQWYVNQNKIAVGLLKITFYSLGKVRSLLGGKVCFSVIASKSLKSSLLDVFRTRLRLKPGLHIVGRIVSMCLRPCPKEHITALQVWIARISCERLLLSKTCVTM